VKIKLGKEKKGCEGEVRCWCWVEKKHGRRNTKQPLFMCLQVKKI